MIQGRLRKGVAIWRCPACGFEQPILQYILVPNYGAHIDMDATISKRDAFIAQHALCKKEFIQYETSTNI